MNSASAATFYHFIISQLGLRKIEWELPVQAGHNNQTEGDTLMQQDQLLY
jgi:hypothetical protein